MFQECEDEFRTKNRNAGHSWLGEGTEFKDCDDGPGTMYVWRGLIGSSRSYILNRTDEAKYLQTDALGGY